MSTPRPATFASLPSGHEAENLPPALQQSLARHRENLVSMVAALRAAGLDETSIENNLGVLIESYRAELSAALHHLEPEA